MYIFCSDESEQVWYWEFTNEEEEEDNEKEEQQAKAAKLYMDVGQTVRYTLHLLMQLINNRRRLALNTRNTRNETK